MSEKHYDAIVVGAGPAGSSVARRATELGVKVLIIDRKRDIGYPIQCGEFLPAIDEFPKILPRAKRAEKLFNLPEWVISNSCSRIAVLGPSKKIHEFKFSSKILDRSRFDKWLVMNATKAGAELWTCCNAISAENDGKEVLVKKEGKILRLKTDVLVAADGPSSKMAKSIELSSSDPDDFAVTIEYLMGGIEIDPDLTEVYFGKEYAPGGYCLTPETISFIKDRGVKQMKDISIGEEVWTRFGWMPISNIYKRPYTGLIITVTPFALNTKVSLTPEHNVLIWNKRMGYCWKRADQLVKSQRGRHRNGDYLVVPIPKTVELIDSIDLWPYLQATALLVEDKIYPKGRNQFGDIFPYKKALPRSLKVSPDLMKFLGFYVAEGNLASSGVIISNTNRALLGEMAALGKRVFRVKPKIFTVMSKVTGKLPCHQAEFCSKLMVRLFKNWFGQGAKNRRLPSWILDLSEQCKEAFLAGLVLGDGWVEKKRNSNWICITTVSKELAYDVWMFLLSMGIVGNIGHTGIGHKAYRVRWEQANVNTKGCRYMFDGENLLLGIRKIEKNWYCGDVFDVESGGEFCAPTIVHNCWIIPKGEGMANVGLGIRPSFSERGVSLEEYLRRFINKHPIAYKRFQRGVILSRTGGLVPVGGPIKKTYSENAIVVGDAAGQVMATNGGGIPLAVICGDIGGEAIAKKLRGENDLSFYEKEWKSEVGKELDAGVKIRKVVDIALHSDRLIEMIFETFGGKIVEDVILCRLSMSFDLLYKTVEGLRRSLKVLK
ncbi:MAG: LAGLIDADG family homing endonuclease [Nitrososphaerales archaeon]